METNPAFEAINRRNAEFWGVACRRRDEQLLDIDVRTLAFRVLSAEWLKGTPLRLQTTVECALEDATFAKHFILDRATPGIEERGRKNAASEMGRKGGSRPKSDRLGVIITEAIRRKPGIELPDLLQELESRASVRDVIQDASNEGVVFEEANRSITTVTIFALAARLRRAKKRLGRR